MADHFLITSYLETLREELGSLPDADEIVAEAADHLIEGTGAHLASGMGIEAAQRTALNEFGDPELVARTFASARGRHLALPSRSTRRSGRYLVAAGAAFLAATAYWTASLIAPERVVYGLPLGIQTAHVLTMFVASLLTIAGVLGFNRRHGGGGIPAKATVGLAIAMSLAMAFQRGQRLPIWATLLGVGALALAYRAWRSSLSPNSTAGLLAVGGVMFLTGLWSLTAVGSHWDFCYILNVCSGALWFSVAPITVIVWMGGLTIYSIGLIRLGRWLASEEAVERPGDTVAA